MNKTLRALYITAGILLCSVSAGVLAQVPRDPQFAQDYVAITGGATGGGNAVITYPLDGPAGTAALPTFAVSNPNTGMYYDTANTALAQSVNSTQVSRYTATAATFPGSVNAVTGVFSGAVSGTTGTFSSTVSGVAGTFTGAVSGTTGSFTTSTTTPFVAASVTGTPGAFRNSSAPAYAYGFADATHTTIYSNSIAALSFDSAGNALSGGNFTVPATNFQSWTGRAQLLSPVDGVVQIYNNAGTVTTGTTGYLIGPATTAGAKLSTQVSAGARLAARLGDNSDYTAMLANQFLSTGNSGVFGTTDINGTNGYTWSSTGAAAVAAAVQWLSTTSTSVNLLLPLTYKETVINITATTTLTAAQTGASVQFTGSTASQILNLPAAAKGLVYELVNDGTVNVSFAAPAGIIQGSTYTTGSTRVLGPGARMRVKCLDATNWSITGLVGTIVS